MKPDAYRQRLEDRILARLVPAGECLEWSGRRDLDGYGLVYVAAHITNQPENHRRLHRVVWMLAHGPIPTDVLVMHTCDNPPCGRLDHLFIGTHTDNMRDKSAKGRWRGRPITRVDITCKGCGREFTVHHHRATTAKFHSLECLRAYRQRQGDES